MCDTASTLSREYGFVYGKPRSIGVNSTWPFPRRLGAMGPATEHLSARQPGMAWRPLQGPFSPQVHFSSSILLMPVFRGKMSEPAPDSETCGSGAKLPQYVEFVWQATPKSLGWNLAAGGLSGPQRRTCPTFGPEKVCRGAPLEAGCCELRGSRTGHRDPQCSNSTNEPGMSMKTKSRGIEKSKSSGVDAQSRRIGPGTDGLSLLDSQLATARLEFDGTKRECL